jgi:hypothetical protein
MHWRAPDHEGGRAPRAARQRARAGGAAGGGRQAGGQRWRRRPASELACARRPAAPEGWDQVEAIAASIARPYVPDAPHLEVAAGASYKGGRRACIPCVREMVNSSGLQAAAATSTCMMPTIYGHVDVTGHSVLRCIMRRSGENRASQPHARRRDLMLQCLRTPHLTVLDTCDITAARCPPPTHLRMRSAMT